MMAKVKLGNICDIKSSKRIFEKEYRDDGVPFYRGKEISLLSKGIEPNTNIYISKEKYQEIKSKFGVSNKGDLLITSVGTIGNTWINDGRDFYYKDGNVTQIVDNEDINTQYISYVFKSNIISRQIRSSGTAQVALTIQKIKNLQIPLPPLPTQRKIVEVLDKAKSLIDMRKQQIALLDNLIESTFYDMFGDPVKNDMGWDVRKFKEILTIKNGKNQRKVEKTDGQYYIYGSGGIMGKATDYICDENTVIIGRKGNINKPIWVKTKFWNVDTAFGLSPDTHLLNVAYLYYFCVRYNFERLNTTTTIPSLTRDRLNNLAMPLPPLELQNQFAQKVEKIEQQKALLNQSLKLMEDNFSSLMQKAFRGEIV